MTSGNRWREEKRAKRVLTELNVETTRLAAICELTGGHTDSGETVTRQFPVGPMDLPVCKSCRVPYKAPRFGWGAISSSSRGGES